MTKANLLGPWVRRFLLEYLVSERNLARNTQCSYRDTLRLLLPFVAQKVQRDVDRISVTDVSPEIVRLFLRHLEESRKCAVATRNQRLAAIPLLGSLCRLAQPGTHRVVRTTPRHSTQEGASGYYYISRQTGNGCIVKCA
jgi:integrase/recombinase XerD